MTGRINLIQSVRQDTHRLITLLQRLPMSTDVYTVCQSADDEHLRTLLTQVADEPSHQVLTVTGMVARSHDVDHVWLVQVGTTLVEQHYRRIRTFAEPLGIVCVVHRKHTNSFLRDKLHLCGSPAQRLVPVFQRLTKSRCTVCQHVTYILSVLINGFPAAHRLIESLAYRLVQSRQACQRYGVVDFFLLHSSVFISPY